VTGDNCRVIVLNGSLHYGVDCFRCFDEFQRAGNSIKGMNRACRRIIFRHSENGNNLIAHSFVKHAVILRQKFMAFPEKLSHKLAHQSFAQNHVEFGVRAYICDQFCGIYQPQLLPVVANQP